MYAPTSRISRIEGVTADRRCGPQVGRHTLQRLVPVSSAEKLLLDLPHLHPELHHLVAHPASGVVREPAIAGSLAHIPVRIPKNRDIRQGAHPFRRACRSIQRLLEMDPRLSEVAVQHADHAEGAEHIRLQLLELETVGKLERVRARALSLIHPARERVETSFLRQHRRHSRRGVASLE
jgi:hypothetical protein